MKMSHRIVVFAACLLMGVWLAVNYSALTGEAGGLSRLVLGGLFAVLILLRPKQIAGEQVGVPDQVVPSGKSGRGLWPALAAIAGACLAVSGIIFNVNQFEWFGLVLVVFASLRWALPESYRRDILLGTILLYFVHPLPSQLVSKLQFVMQKLSVSGAEGILQVANVRAWADGMILRTSGEAFEVPAACSGMTTSVTVGLCAIGIAILFRFRWYGIVTLVFAGLAQVLILNIVRISATVGLSPHMPPEWGQQFLHDSMGAFLLASVLLVQLEAVLWRRKKIRRKRKSHREERTDRAPLPAFWSGVIRYGIASVVVAGIVLAIAFVSYKLRPMHRAAMIAGVASNLSSSDAESSERALTEALRLKPNDIETRTERARVRVLRGRYNEAQEDLDAVPAALRDPHFIVLQSWIYMGLNRTDDALALIAGASPEIRDLPGICMVRAELAVRKNDPEVVAREVVKAAKWDMMINRVRVLFPYLAGAGEWDAIARSDSGAPYREITQGLVAAHAQMKMGNLPGAARVLLSLMKQWKNDPRLIRYLFVMAVARPASSWEDLFTEKMLINIDKLSVEELAMSGELCLQISRPDIAWIAFGKLESLDSAHPALKLLPAWMGDRWMTFRKRFLNVSAGMEYETLTLDQKTYHYLQESKTPWKGKWEEIPLVTKLGSGKPEEVREFRKKCLAEAIVEFERREAGGKLALEMRYRHVTALELSGRLDEAHDMLKLIGEEVPLEKNKVRVVRGSMYARVRRWEDVYEMLRGCIDERNPQLSALLLLADSQRRLRMGLCALQTIQEAALRFPESPRAAFSRALIVRELLGPEEALFALDVTLRMRTEGLSELLEVDVMDKTGRFVEAQRTAEANMVRYIRGQDAADQRLTPPAAEMSLKWHLVTLPQATDFEANAVTLRVNKEASKSPFLARMMQMWLDTYGRTSGGKTLASSDEATSAEMDQWEACGRDGREKAVALHQLAMLYGRFGQPRQYAAAVNRAITHMPESAVLWRASIGLANADEAVISKAAAACPADPEIWLAGLVTGLKTKAGAEAEAWLMSGMNMAVAKRKFSPATMVRAGDMCFRAGFVNPAAVAARDAENRSLGLLSAHYLALKCAFALDNTQWAASSASKAIDVSINPHAVLYATMASLRKGGMKADSDVINALKKLKIYDPSNLLWTEMLGRARFELGSADMVEAYEEMKSLLDKGMTNMSAYVFAAEAARRMDRVADAVAILKKGLVSYPGDFGLVNNLVYTLACDPRMVREAVEMIPNLLSIKKDNLHGMDTATYAYIKAGKLDEAEATVKQILSIVGETPPASTKPNSPEGVLFSIWIKARLHLAEIQLLRGDPDKAQLILAETSRNCGHGVSDDDINEIGRIVSEVESALISLGRIKEPDLTVDFR